MTYFMQVEPENSHTLTGSLPSRLPVAQMISCQQMMKHQQAYGKWEMKHYVKVYTLIRCIANYFDLDENP